jgi:hypothetical protein
MFIDIAVVGMIGVAVKLYQNAFYYLGPDAAARVTHLANTVDDVIGGFDGVRIVFPGDEPTWPAMVAEARAPLTFKKVRRLTEGLSNFFSLLLFIVS